MITEEGILPIKGGQWEVLTASQIEKLHRATVEVLEEVGIKCLHPGAREIMSENGCEVDHDNQLVKIPQATLMKYLKKAPSEITLYGRDPKYDVHLNASGDVYVMGGAGALDVLDLEGNRRPAKMSDLKNLTRLEDTLEYLDIAHYLVTPGDLEQEGSIAEMMTFAHNLTNNTRNFYALIGGCKEGLEYELEMASVVSGSVDKVMERPFFVAGLCVDSPLTHRRDFIEELFACADYNIPCYIEADALAGGTAPCTISGCVVEINANVLAGIALAQMLKPGLPCIYSSSSGILDMDSLYFAGSTPEATLIHMASAQMAHSYDLPYYGANSPDSKLPDAQMGYERAQHFLGCALGGVNIIHVAIGMLEMMTLASYEQCLIDNEILGATARLIQGIDCSREAIGVDIFKQVGHNASFVSTKHSAKYCKGTERWEPELTDRYNWNMWIQETGGKDMRERAKERVKEILSEHHPVYVSESERQEIWKIAEEAQKALKEKEQK